MALEALSGAVYQDATRNVTKQKMDVGTQEQPTSNITITEVPGIPKTSGSNQTGKEQENSQNASEQQIKQAIRQANNKMKEHRTRCEFSYHEDTKRVSIKVYDKDTEEVIREIPPEETLEMVQKMWELAGILVDERR